VRITIIGVGSRGDVQPYVALGCGLQAAGHQVRLATHEEFRSFVGNHGLEFFLLEGDPRAILASDTGQKWQKTSRNPLGFVQQMRNVAAPLIKQIMQNCLEACSGADLVLYSFLGVFAAASVVEALHIPAYAAYLQPDTPTRAFASYRFPPAPTWLEGRKVTHYYNRATWPMMGQLFWLFLRDLINDARQSVLHLHPLSVAAPDARDQRHLYGYSPVVIPRPADWGHHDHVTGYWFLDRLASWQPPNDLIHFLAAGPPPIYVGFGSMNNRRPEETTSLVLQALARTGQRGILLPGWGGLTQVELPETVLKIDEVPHDWLFPQMQAVVHHGGVGTTAAGLYAGVPNVIIPYFADQPLWGRRVFELGVGPDPIPRKQLSVEGLAQAIQRAVADSQLRERARRLGEKIRAEDGVATAVNIINRSDRPTQHGLAARQYHHVSLG